MSEENKDDSTPKECLDYLARQKMLMNHLKNQEKKEEEDGKHGDGQQ